MHTLNKTFTAADMSLTIMTLYDDGRSFSTDLNLYGHENLLMEKM